MTYLTYTLYGLENNVFMFDFIPNLYIVALRNKNYKIMYYQERRITYDLFFSKEQKEFERSILPFLTGLDTIMPVEEAEEDEGETFLLLGVLIPKRYKSLAKQGKGLHPDDEKQHRIHLTIRGEDRSVFENHVHKFFGVHLCKQFIPKEYC